MKEQIAIVRIVLKTADGRVLLLRRHPESAWSPGKYELPGGKVEVGSEDLGQAARREIYEEAGIQLEQPLQLIHAVTEEFRGTHYIVMAYEAQLEAEPAVKLSAEHDAMVWASLQELQQIEVTSHTTEIVMLAINGSTTPEESKSIDVKKSTESDELIINTDGGSRGNPGPSASGYVIMDANEDVLEEGGEYLGITTNNQAEYQAVKLALEQANKFHPRRITFRIDSQLVVRQMNGEYKIRNRDLWPIHARIKELMALYPRVTFHHVYREFNRLADAKVNEILDSHKGSN